MIATSSAPVLNFGWPCFEGDDALALLASAPIYAGLAKAATTGPAFSYRHGTPEFAGSACTGTASSNSAIAFAGANAYPARLHGALFLGDFSRGCITAARRGIDGRPDFGAMEDIVIDAPGRGGVPATGAAAVAIVPLAPDGTIQLYTNGRTHILIDVIAWIPAPS